MKPKSEKEDGAPSRCAKSCASQFVPGAGTELVGQHRRGETKLELPVGEPDLEALRSLTHEWLVPLLVEKFLLEQGVGLRARPNASPPQKANFKT
jgi:hypothetical protein